MVTLNNTPPNVSAGPDKVLTCTVTQVTLEGSSTTAGVTYAWVASNGGHIVSGATTATPTVDAAGTYTLTVTNPANGCTATDAAVVTLNNTPPMVRISSQTNVDCFGNSTGSATVTATGGTEPYTYLWSPMGGSLATASGLPAGTYTVTVTDANGCTAQASVTITQPTAPLTCMASVTLPISTPGGNDGEATVVPSGGTSPYTYSWNTVPVQTGATATGLSAGTYTVKVTDHNQCTTTCEVTLGDPTLNLYCNFENVHHVTCEGGSDGSATVQGYGGTPPYQYAWNTVPVQYTQTATGLKAGTYTVTVTDSRQMTSTCDVVIRTLPDDTPPLLTCPPTLHAICDVTEVPAYLSLREFLTAEGKASDNCGLDEDSFDLFSEVSDGRNCPETITRTYQISDLSGNSATCTQTIIVNDEEDPVFEPVESALSFECLSEVPEAGYLSWTDNCDGTGEALGTDMIDDHTACNSEPATLNASGNGLIRDVEMTGTGLSAKNIDNILLQFETNKGKGRAEFTLISPYGEAIMLTGPYCSGTPYCDDPEPKNQELYQVSFFSCSSDFPKWNNYDNIPQGPSSYEPFGGGVSETPNEGYIAREIPRFKGYVSCFDDLQGDMDGTWTIYSRKQQSSNGDIKFLSICLTPAMPCSNDVVIHRTWTATDACGNRATATQKITVSDRTAPHWTTAAGSLDRTVECLDYEALAAAQALVPTATDNCDGEVAAVKTAGEFVPATCGGTWTNTWKAVDECGNVSLPFVQVITLTDATAPVITCGEDMIVQAGEEGDYAMVTLPEVTATDRCDSHVEVTGIRSDNKLLTEPYPVGVTTVTWIAVDDCMNRASCSITVTVVKAQTGEPYISCPPALSVVCPDDVPAPYASLEAFRTAGGVARDDQMIVSFTLLSEVSDGKVCYPTLTRTYQIADNDGNTAECTQMVRITDTVAPVVPVHGASTVECVASATAPQLPAVTDNCGAVITPVWVSTVNTPDPLTCQGTRVYTYSYKDCSGNESIWKYTYTIDRTLAPKEVGGPVATTRMVETLELAGPPAQLPVVHDACGNVLTPSDPEIVTSGECDGSKRYTYTYADCAGLKFTWIFTNVITRTTPPAEIAPLVSNSGSAVCLSDISAPVDLPVVKDVNGVTLLPTTTSPVITTVGDQCEATVKYTYHYVDCAGLTFDWVFTWSVKDDVAPQFVVPADLTITAGANCSYDASPSVTGEPAELYDHCSDELTTVWSDVVVRGAIPGEWIITRTWTVADECGNATMKDQLITVVGAGGPPELILPEFHCIYLTKYGKWTLGSAEMGRITAGSSAQCGTSSDLTFEFSRRAFSCNDIYAPVKVKVTATDGGGNTAEGYFNVLVYDTISPVALCRNVDLTLDGYGQAFLFPGFVDNGSSDNCGIDQMILSKQLFTTADIGSHQVKMTIVDRSGNTDFCTATVNIYGKATTTPAPARTNMAPTIADVAGVTIVKEPLLLEIPLTQITAGETDGSQNVVSVTATSDNPMLFTGLQVEYIPGEKSGMLIMSVAPGVSGEAVVTLSVKDNGGTANGGSDTTLKQFRVTVTAGSDAISVILLDGAGSQLATSIAGVKSDFALKVWPNPTKGRVNIDLTWNGIRQMEVKVYNMLGVEVFNREYKAGEMVWFDLSDKTSGMYLVQMNIGGTPVIHKVILDRK